MLQLLPIGDAVTKDIAEMVAWAAQRDHWYRPGVGARVPGSMREHCCLLGTYRCVFSYTIYEKEIFRHLSTSVIEGNLPAPIAVLALAKMFGFTGSDDLDAAAFPKNAPADWWIGVRHKDEENGRGHIVVAQKVLGLVP